MNIMKQLKQLSAGGQQQKKKKVDIISCKDVQNNFHLLSIILVKKNPKPHMAAFIPLVVYPYA